MRDKRPCAYCWNPEEPEGGWTMENLPEPPPGGLAPVHSECEQAVVDYVSLPIEERA